MGLLTITGTLAAGQFWPGGRSDADTATVILAAKNAFVFTDDAGKRHSTKAFDNAEVIGQHGRSPVIKKARNGSVRKITVRLQGIDAPELHYQPQVPGSAGKGLNHPFRQSLGETSADELLTMVTSVGRGDIPCEVRTLVATPNDVCDVFGRIVGNLVLTIGGASIDLNHRLLREGWVLPGLYNSMSKEEIRAVLADHEAAKRAKRGLFSRDIVTSRLAPFDASRIEEKGTDSFKPFDDLGPVNFPKFFRRDAERFVRSSIGENTGASLEAFIAMRKTDVAIETEHFFKLKGRTTGPKPRREFKQLAAFLKNGHYPVGPELVFWESDSTLVKAGTQTEITRW
jgi:endonuclease YncB( thermonuclease family)